MYKIAIESLKIESKMYHVHYVSISVILILLSSMEIYLSVLILILKCKILWLKESSSLSSVFLFEMCSLSSFVLMKWYIKIAFYKIKQLSLCANVIAT